MGVHVDVLCARQVRPAAAGVAARGARRRQRAGGDGHLRRDPARHHRRRACSPAVARQHGWAWCSARWRSPGLSRRRLLIPRLPAGGARLWRIDWNPWSSSWRHLSAARESRTVFLSLLGMSWFWFYGALLLAQLPAYVPLRDQRRTSGVQPDAGGTRRRASAAASLLCERLSGRKVEIGLVPFGSIGLTLFGRRIWPGVPGLRRPRSTLDVRAVPGAAARLADARRISSASAASAVSTWCRCTRWCSSARRRGAVARASPPTACLNALFMVAAAALRRGGAGARARACRSCCC